MVNPHQIINYTRSNFELEELAIFSVCVAGKKARDIAPRVNQFIGGAPFPLWDIYLSSEAEVAQRLKQAGIGCYNQRAQSLVALADAVVQGRLDLKTCTVADLEAIPWFGPKTARLFILHSRPGAEVAVLDRHILKHLGAAGHKVPKDTPPVRSRYQALEQAFLAMARAEGMSPADYDLMIWKKYESRDLT